MPVGYSLREISEIVKKNRKKQTEFLSGRRKEGLDKLFFLRGKTVRTGKSFVHKLLIEIGLQTLKIKSVQEGKTANGFPKVTISFYKSPTEGWYNNSDLQYATIDCTHLLMESNTGDFKSSWFKPFTREFTREDFKKIIPGKEIKCIVLHREEAFMRGGQQMIYKQGRNMGKPIVLIKPEIIKVFHIDTPDEDIELNYFTLYKPLKK